MTHECYIASDKPLDPIIWEGFESILDHEVPNDPRYTLDVSYPEGFHVYFSFELFCFGWDVDIGGNAIKKPYSEKNKEKLTAMQKCIKEQLKFSNNVFWIMTEEAEKTTTRRRMDINELRFYDEFCWESGVLYDFFDGENGTKGDECLKNARTFDDFKKIGDTFFQGDGVLPSYRIAAEAYLRSKMFDDPQVLSRLVYMYEKGFGVPQDHKEALKWQTRLAEQGDPKEQFELGDMYSHYAKFSKNYFKNMKKWYRMAADHDYLEAQQKMGLMYEMGRGVDIDLDKAEYWYRKAADQGDLNSRLMLERVLDKKHNSGK